MRLITEESAKIIFEVLQGRIAYLQANPYNTKIENKIRLIKRALKELQTNKTIKNGRIKSK
jgi:hypothetical protein